jgi:hypothetical protein
MHFNELANDREPDAEPPFGSSLRIEITGFRELPQLLYEGYREVTSSANEFFTGTRGAVAPVRAAVR